MRIILKLTLAAALFLSLSPASAQKCKAKQIVKGCKTNLAPFKYDSYAVNDLVFTDKEQIVPVEFTAFAGQKYKLVFCTSGFPEQVTLNIYDKPARNKNRKKIYDSSSGIDNLFWSFEPPKSGTYYIEYTLPPSKTGKESKGCILMLIGFK